MVVTQCLPPSKPLTACSLNPNYGAPKGTMGRGGVPIQGILIHCSTKPIECLSARLKPNLPRLFSAHFDISTGGAVTEHVRPEDIAWAFPEQLSVLSPDLSKFHWTLVQQNPGTALDRYLIEVVFDIHQKAPIDTLGCVDCTLTENSDGYKQMIRLIAWLSATYAIPLDVGHIQLHQNIEEGVLDECPCLDIVKILCQVEDYCEKPDHVSDARFEKANPLKLTYVYGEDDSKQLVKISIPELKALLS